MMKQFLECGNDLQDGVGFGVTIIQIISSAEYLILLV